VGVSETVVSVVVNEVAVHVEVAASLTAVVVPVTELSVLVDEIVVAVVCVIKVALSVVVVVVSVTVLVTVEVAVLVVTVDANVVHDEQRTGQLLLNTLLVSQKGLYDVKHVERSATPLHASTVTGSVTGTVVEVTDLVGQLLHIFGQNFKTVLTEQLSTVNGA
jgi:hypothetical protein